MHVPTYLLGVPPEAQRKRLPDIGKEIRPIPEGEACKGRRKTALSEQGLPKVGAFPLQTQQQTPHTMIQHAIHFSRPHLLLVILDLLIIDDICHLDSPIVLPPLRSALLQNNRPPFSLVTTVTAKNKAYPYTQDLLTLHNISAQSSFIPQLEGISTIATPLRPLAWEEALLDHPDQRLAGYISDGLRNGFRIGHDKTLIKRPSASNMLSASNNPDPVQKYVDNELAEQRIIGPFTSSATTAIHVSRSGVIPKRHQPGRWRLILDLSSPEGMSVNDGIDKDLSSLQYESVDDAARILTGIGRGALLAKIDIAHAYRNVPVHPSDRYLLGMQWMGRVYIDTALPFGLRSAPKIFCALSDTLEWILLQAGISSCLHYLDDFLTLGAPESLECQRNLKVLIGTCETLGIPLAIEKIEGPIARITFLGIEFDSQTMTMRLPEEKLRHLRDLIGQWISKKAATKRSMLSLIGELAHASKVVIPGRTFLRRIIDCAHSRRNLDHWIRLNEEFRSDLYWWHLYLEQWNGVSLLAAHVYHPPDFTLFTDASGNWGCGGTDGSDWFQGAWSKEWAAVNITTKELVPIVLAVAVWGRRWAGSHVRVRSDNMAVVEILKARSSRDAGVMHLLRCLHFFCARHDIRISATHIAVENVMADALSRNNLPQFFLSCSKAHTHPTPVPPTLWSLVVEQQPDWLSQDWRSKLSNS